MIEGRNFVITSLQRWDVGIGANIKDISLEISKNNRVLFINTPINGKKEIKDIRLNEIIKGRLWVLDIPMFMLPVNFIPDGFFFDLVNKINQVRLYTKAKKVINELGFKDSILIIDNDIYRSFYAVDILKPAFSLYYRRDNMISKYWKSHAPRVEPLLCGKCDGVIANIYLLLNSIKKYNNYTFDVGQGVDLSKYIPEGVEMPEPMKGIKSPIIGYTGLITSLRLDADLLYGLAKSLPHYSFVFVGSRDELFASHQLNTLENVHFLGEKKNEEMPGYMASFDVCINPQIVNEITICNYPRKIDEYLAMGKPVVATATQAMSIFEEHIICCNSKYEWINALSTALTKEYNNDEMVKSRVEFAHTHSWENSVYKIYNAIKYIEDNDFNKENNLKDKRDQKTT